MLPRPFSLAACSVSFLLASSLGLRAQSPSPSDETLQSSSRVETPAQATPMAAPAPTTGSLPPAGMSSAGETARDNGNDAAAAATSSAEPVEPPAGNMQPSQVGANVAAPTGKEPPSSPQAQQAAPAEKPGSPALALDPTPGGDGEPDPLTPKESAEPAPAAPGAPAATPAPAGTATAASPSAPAAVPTDPIVAEVLKKLADTPATGKQKAQSDDRAALKSFYDTPQAKPVWVTSSGFSERGQQAIAELKRADDWGLRASDYDIPTLAGGSPEPTALADAEIDLGLDVLAYARHARGGRVDPRTISQLIDRKPRIYDPKTVMLAIAAAPAADVYLRSLHPKHPQFEKLRQALLTARNPADASKDVVGKRVEIPKGPLLKPGMSHPQVALVRQRLGLQASENADTYDDSLVAAVEAFQREHGLRVDGLVGANVRAAMNGRPRPSRASDLARLVVNMERWRWMPDDLGEFYVWDSVTEQRTNIVKHGQIVFSEKIVVGKPSTPTPSFSADMKFVIFHPTWGVPNGIKTNELAPYLRRAAPANDFFSFFDGGGGSASRVLERFGGLVPSYNGRPVNPDSVDWSRVDIRRFNFTQPPGPRNVLGVVKFRFPNKHDVYMHDTPERHLFNGPSRAFSHGCMRVQNPVRMAEVILEYDRGWSSDRVRSMVDARSSTTDVALEKRVPVHIAYFTAIADEGGRIRYASDIYGLDSRIASALEGRRVEVGSRAEPVANVEPSSSEAAPRVSNRRRTAQRRRPLAPMGSSDNPFSGLFQW